jgi:hypothetical protein
VIESDSNRVWTFRGIPILCGLALIGFLASCAGSDSGTDPDPVPPVTATASAELPIGASTATIAVPSATAFLRPTSIAVPTIDEQPPAIASLVSKLAAERGLKEAEVLVLSFESQTWSSTALGCPDPGRSYAQIVTEGFEVLLSVPGELLIYHVDLGGNAMMRCERDDLD